MWIPVTRRRGDPSPPTAIDSSHVPAMIGSTSRSKCKSIGSDTVRPIELNGTTHRTAMNAASIHGSTRVVRGQSPAVVGARGRPSDRSARTLRSKGSGGSSGRLPLAAARGRSRSMVRVTRKPSRPFEVASNTPSPGSTEPPASSRRAAARHPRRTRERNKTAQHETVKTTRKESSAIWSPTPWLMTPPRARPSCSRRT